MRMYVKLVLMTAVAVAVQLSARRALNAAWELEFALRCRMAENHQDTQALAGLVDERGRRDEMYRRERGQTPVFNESLLAAWS